MSAVPEVVTERLLLRGWRDADTGPWGELCADAEVMRPLGREGGISLGDAWREMAMLAGHWTLKGFGHWVAAKLGMEPEGRAQVRGFDLRVYGIDV